jgi:hypothetical protein
MIGQGSVKINSEGIAVTWLYCLQLLFRIERNQKMVVLLLWHFDATVGQRKETKEMVLC